MTAGHRFAIQREWPRRNGKTKRRAKIKLGNHSVDASSQSLVNRPLTFSDSLLIPLPYCSKQLLVLSAFSASGSLASNQSELCDLISSLGLSECYPISGTVFSLFLLTIVPVVEILLHSGRYHDISASLQLHGLIWRVHVNPTQIFSWEVVKLTQHFVYVWDWTQRVSLQPWPWAAEVLLAGYTVGRSQSKPDQRLVVFGPTVKCFQPLLCTGGGSRVGECLLFVISCSPVTS